MCGIAGLVNLKDLPPPDPGLLRRMAGAVRHRGPDEFGIYRDARAGLAHARLSIIDLSTGQQPLSNEDGSLWIVFNGEVYNYLELREDLERRGHRFRTRSDTEVLVHAYEEWGERSVERFNGQFALALWDRRALRLFLARDRLGVRPLYHSASGGRFAFASEVKSLFADPAFPREIDPEGLDQVFTFWTTVAPVTVFRGIRELTPGHTLTVDFGAPGSPAMRERGYWQPRFPARGEPYDLSLPEAADALEAQLDRATRLRMLRSDVPVGSYLSGGIDSSIIAALGRRAKEGVFRTFSLRFEDAEFDETIYQRIMVEHLGSEHTDVRCTKTDIAEVFPDVVLHAERPVLRTAPAPLYLLSRLVRDAGFKVVLTGEGSDEMLGGYDVFREAKVRAFWARQPASASRPLLLEKLYPYLARSPSSARAMARKFFAQGLDRIDDPAFSHLPRWTAAAALKRFFSAPLAEATRGIGAVERLMADLPPEFATWEPLSRAQYLEVRTLLSGYLLSSQGDRMLMAHSVEGRFPFLDPDVVEFANALPASYKLHVLDEKHILKRAARGLVPQAILERPKQPYRAPDALSFVGPDTPGYVDDLLSPAAVRAASLFRPEAVAGLLAKCRAKAGEGQFSNADNMAFVGVLSSQLLWDRLIRSRPDAPEPPPGALKTRVDLAGEKPGA
jgi:asparagine synthase (glutamine-hydrolysing)